MLGQSCIGASTIYVFKTLYICMYNINFNGIACHLMTFHDPTPALIIYDMTHLYEIQCDYYELETKLLHTSKK